MGAEGRSQGARVRDDGDAAVVGHVQGLVRVGRPRVGVREARHEVREGRRGGRPQAERAVHVHPGPTPMSEVDGLGEGVKGARVEISRLQADDDRLAVGDLLECCFQRLHAQPALVVSRDGARMTQAKVTKRQVDGVVALCSDHHVDSRRPSESQGVDVPTHLIKHVEARRGQASEVRHSAPGDEAHVTARRKPE